MAAEPAPEPAAAPAAAVPSLALADLWEADPFLRGLAREKGCLTKWPSEKVIGIASTAAMSLNTKSMEPLASWWAQQKDLPQAVPIDVIRPEARCPQICPPNGLEFRLLQIHKSMVKLL
jgi:hypothetical protein